MFNFFFKSERPGKEFNACLAVAALALTVLGVCFSVFTGVHLDEKGHYAQIRWFLEGNLSLFRDAGGSPVNAMLPGYHAFMALLGGAVGTKQPFAFRIFNTVIGLSLVASVYFEMKRFLGDYSLMRALQFYFLPIFLPFVFLIYTDVFSLLLQFLMLAAALRKRYLLSALLATACLMVRQTSIVPILAMASYLAYLEGGFSRSPASVAACARRIWAFGIPMVLFAAFVIANGRISVDDPRTHSIALDLGNLLFSLFCFFILLIPMHVANFKAILAMAIERKAFFISIAITVVLLVFTYEPQHLFNNPKVCYFLIRNQFLFLLTSSMAGRIVFSFCSVYAIYSFMAMSFLCNARWFIVLLWIASLAPIVLVEPRYYIPIFFLAMLFRRNEKFSVEFMLLLYSLSLGAVACIMVFRTEYLI